MDCAGAAPGEEAYLPSAEQQQGRPEIFTDARDWYAQAQAKSVCLEFRMEHHEGCSYVLFRTRARHQEHANSNDLFITTAE